MYGLPVELQDSIKELSQHYENFEPNDRGANGYLLFARNKVTGTPIAIKFYSGEPGEARHDEPKQLSAIKSGNVLPIMDARNVSDEWGYFATPRCFEGDIDDHIAIRPPAYSAIDVALGICNGLSAIHSLNMVHRDLKPGNIVMLHGSPQIADFGSVRQLEHGGSVHASKHSVLFRPPESFASGQYTRQGDIYQVGLVTYQLLGGSLSYEYEDYLTRKQKDEYVALSHDADRSIYVDNIIRGRAEQGRLLDFATLPPWVNAVARRGLRSFTNPDPGQRSITIAEVAAILTQMRAAMLNWAWHGDIARLATDGRVIELRPVDGISYEAYLSRNGGPFRRAPNVKAAPLTHLVKGF